MEQQVMLYLFLYFLNIFLIYYCYLLFSQVINDLLYLFIKFKKTKKTQHNILEHKVASLNVSLSDKQSETQTFNITWATTKKSSKLCKWLIFKIGAKKVLTFKCTVYPKFLSPVCMCQPGSGLTANNTCMNPPHYLRDGCFCALYAS